MAIICCGARRWTRGSSIRGELAATAGGGSDGAATEHRGDECKIATFVIRGDLCIAMLLDKGSETLHSTRPNRSHRPSASAVLPIPKEVLYAPWHAHGPPSGRPARSRRAWRSRGSDDDDTRTIFVETTSSPSNLGVHVSIGFSHTAESEAPTPDVRNVRVDGLCSRRSA
jgi:hypothetical protein